MLYELALERAGFLLPFSMAQVVPAHSRSDWIPIHSLSFAHLALYHAPIE
jgi:hypothetical protein